MRRIINEANNEIMARCNDPSELYEEKLTVDEMQYFRNHQDEFFYKLGLIDPNSKTNSVPRLFVLGADENGNAKVFDLSAVDIKAGSDEFWKQVQLGNVFAYPAGENDPVQIQVGATDSNGITLGISKPVTAENLPDPPVYKLSAWQKFASWFGFYKKEVHMAQHREEEQNALRSKLEAMQTVRKSINKDQETADVAEGERILKERKDIKDLEYAKEKRDALKIGMKNMTDVFVPEPRFNPDIEKIADGPNKKEGLYTKKQFKNLTVYSKKDIDLDTIQVGGSGKTVTDEEFASVTMYALWNPKNSMKGYNQMAPDIHGEKSLMDLGFEKKEIPTLLTSRSRGWWTTDLFVNPPRDNEGSYFKEVTNAGRKDAVEAFQAYKNGDKTKLAQILADGVNMAADDMKMVQQNKMEAQNNAVMVTSGKLLDLMEKDPQLKELALQQGMKEDHLKVVEGNRQLEKIAQDARDAEYEIKKAKIEGKELSAEDKAKYSKAIVKEKIALARMSVDNEKECEATLQKVGIIGSGAKAVNKNDLETWNKNPSKRPSPGKGKIWMDTMQHCMGSIYKIYNPLTESLGQLSAEKGLQTLDKIAEQVVKQEGMAQKPTEWLAGEIDKPTIDMAKSMANAVNAVAHPGKVVQPAQNEQVVKENEIAPKKSVNDLKNIFESKQPGPIA